MPNIKPVSDLRNYNEVLKDISAGNPVYLTRNGRGRFVVMDIDEYEALKSERQLLSALARGERSARDKGWLSLDEVESRLKNDNDTD